MSKKNLVVRNAKGYDYTLEGNVVTVIDKDGTKVQKELELGKSVYSTVMSVIRSLNPKRRTKGSNFKVGNFTYKYEEGVVFVYDSNDVEIAKEKVNSDKYLRNKVMAIICNTLK